MLKKLIFSIFLIIFTGNIASNAQDDFKIDLGAYADAYYMYDNAAMDTLSGDFRHFSFLNARKDQFALNIAQVSASMLYGDKVRGQVTLQHGTLVQTAYGGFAVQEAYAGYQFIENLWVDAGYYLTHIGGESFLPKDNWLSTHSIVTYFEPFYHAGIRATYTAEPFVISLQVNNGNGIFTDNNYNKSFGAYLAYNLDDMLTISYANIIGNEQDAADPAKLHQLHNVVVYFMPVELLELKGQVDYAMLEDAVAKNDGTFDSGTYLGFSLQARLNVHEKVKPAIRFAMIDDEDMVYGTGLNGMEFSAGLEYKPVEKSYIKLEGGLLQFDENEGAGNVFTDPDGELSNSRFYVGLNFGVWFN